MPVTIQPTTLRYKNGNAFSTVDCLKGDPGSISSIAPDYSDLTFPIAEGKLCTYEDKLYKANQLIATSEAWTAAHWTETTVEAELQNGSGGEMFLVTVTSEEVFGEEVLSADKTVAEIKAAILADKNVVVSMKNDTDQSNYEYSYYSLDHISELSGNTSIIFTRLLGTANEAIIFENHSGSQDDSVVIDEVLPVINLEAVAPYYKNLSFPILQGTLCLYEDHLLYKANQNIGSQEDFDYDHWDMTNIVDEMSVGSPFIITISTERPRGGTRSNPTLYSDKSSTEIWEAIDAGKVIMIADVTDDDYNGDAVSALVGASSDRNNEYVTLTTRPSPEIDLHYIIGLEIGGVIDSKLVQKTHTLNPIMYEDGTSNFIDDTAGDGDTGSVWSADKSYAEVSGLSSAINAKQDAPETAGTAGQVLGLATENNELVPKWIDQSGGGGGDLPNDFPTEETLQDVLEEETCNTGLTDVTLIVIGMLFDNLPQDETAQNILNSIELECERLTAIYDGWIAEREGA